MFTDPLSVTYNGSAKSLVRTSSYAGASTYRTSDGEFELNIVQTSLVGGSKQRVEVSLARVLPDPTPSNSFDNYYEVSNSVSLAFEVPVNRWSSSTDLPLLRTALLALVDSTFQGRLVAGEN